MSNDFIPSWSKTLECLSLESLDGDKIILPSSVLEELLRGFNQILPSPLIFKILDEKSGLHLHVGVREFTSNEGSAFFPNWVNEAFNDFSQSSDNLTLKFTVSKLPKGSWAKLTSVDNDLKLIKNVRAMFEASLRSNFTALTKGQFLWAQYGGKKLKFLVEELKPENAVDIIDTDLEIDIVSPANLESSELPLINNNNQKRVIPLDTPIKQSISKGIHFFEFLWDRNSDISITLRSSQIFGPDIFALPGIQESSENTHLWAVYSSSRFKKLHIPSTDPLFKSSYHYSFSISSSIECDYEVTVGDFVPEIEEDLTPNEDEYNCETCLKNVSKSKAAVHSAFCARNNIACKECRSVFLKKDFNSHWHCEICNFGGDVLDKDRHFDFFHRVKMCECKTEVPGYHGLSRHKIIDCSQRLMECRYCHNMVLNGDFSNKPEDRLLNLTEHESYCGDRTIACAKCSAHVALKKMMVHAQYHDYLKQRQPPPFAKCINFGCIRPQPVEPNVLKFCQSCFSPFWSPNFDPGNKLLLSKMARKYHGQLTTGCNNSWCCNPHCATSIGKNLDPTAAALSLFPLLKVPQSSSDQCYFCMDSSSIKRWQQVMELKSRIGERYLVEWCIKALETTENDVNAAISWLRSHAPTITS